MSSPVVTTGENLITEGNTEEVNVTSHDYPETQEISGLSDIDGNITNDGNENVGAQELSRCNDDVKKAKRFGILLLKCVEAINYESMFQELIMSTIFIEDIAKTHSVGSPHLLVAEKQLLLLATYPYCTDGIVYAMPLILETNGQMVLYLRCFESGIFHGFFRSNWQILFKDLILMHNTKDCFIINIFNVWDILAAQSHRTDLQKEHRPAKNAKIFKNITMLNKTSLNGYLPIAHAVFKKDFGDFAPGYVLYCQRMARYTKAANMTDNWYFKVEGLGATWENHIKRYTTEQPICTNLTIEEVTMEYVDDEELSLYQQFVVLSTCPNYHHWVSKKNHGVKKQDHFLPHGKSPRNQLMSAVLSSGHVRDDVNEMCSVLDFIASLLKHVINKVYHLDCAPKLIVKRKRAKERTVKKIQLTSNDLLDHLGISSEDYDSLREQSSMSLSVYENFKKNLFVSGTILWRIKNDTKQVVIMNDYHSERGDFEFNDYVTVTRHIEDTNVSYSCSCDTYKVLMTTVQCSYGQSEWDGITCCHCRVFSEITSKYMSERSMTDEHGYHSSFNETIQCESVMAKRINEAVQSVTLPVVLLPAMHKDVEKFSVRSGNEVEFVHIFKSNISEDVFVKCCSGICQSRFSKKRNVVHLYQNREFCVHLIAFKDYLVENKEKHPMLKGDDQLIEGEQLTNEDDDDNGGDEGINEDIFHIQTDLPETEELDDNDDAITDDNDISTKCKSGFNPETGMWLFYSRYGRNVSSDPFGESLLENCIERQRCSVEQLRNPATFTKCFYPQCDTDICKCELPWRIDENGQHLFQFDGMTNLYTKTCSLQCQVFKIVCRNGECIIRWDGYHDNIYRISSMVCAGEEICWSYVEMVCSMKSNFSAFCSQMNLDYKRHRSSKPFMSPKTFRRLFISWASHQNVDFRSPCNWCGFSPKILACDAAKIGISQKHCHINPIDKRKDGQPARTNHRRYDRCFLSYPNKVPGETVAEVKAREKRIRDARSHLKLIMSSVGGAANQNTLTQQQLLYQNEELLKVFPSSCKILLQRVMSQQVNFEQLGATTRLFYILSFDAPLRSFIPSKLMSSVEKIVKGESLDEEFLQSFSAECRNLNHCLGSFVLAFLNDNTLQNDAMNVIRYVFDRIRSVHDNDIGPEDTLPIPGTYNPPALGRSYYFSPSGSQIREARSFAIDCKTQPGPGVHDDAPTTSTCSKRYPIVTKKGSTFLFLWFCPMHGHCYGCHIVDGSEGRKDPANSLYTHLAEAPEVIFYDFSCSLEEYCMNRKSGYFKNTRFYHDIFHGYTHNCSPIYSSKGLRGLESVNTSICEQFNSFLQCIKSSAKQMSQEHFMFFTQFMINIWNNKKQQTFSNKLKMALSGAS